MKLYFSRLAGILLFILFIGDGLLLMVGPLASPWFFLCAIPIILIIPLGDKVAEFMNNLMK
jgi:MFS-type transporter involved in bile tolerance (Atg22 family)